MSCEPEYYVYKLHADADDRMVTTRVHTEIGERFAFVFASMLASKLSITTAIPHFVTCNWEPGAKAAFVNGISIPVNHE